MTPSQPTVVTATPMTSCSHADIGVNPSAPCTHAKYIATRNEIVIPASSLHTFTRYQNQRSRKTSPVPAPICSRIWNPWPAVSSCSAIEAPSTISPTVDSRPTVTSRRSLAFGFTKRR